VIESGTSGMARADSVASGKSGSMSSVSSVKTLNTDVTSSQHLALHGAAGGGGGVPGGSAKSGASSRNMSRSASNASMGSASHAAGGIHAAALPGSAAPSTTASTPRMPSRAGSTASAQGDRRALSRQSSTASQTVPQQQPPSRQLSVASSAATGNAMARNNTLGFARSNTAGSNASRLENEQGALMARSITGNSATKRSGAVQVGMEWDEAQQEWVMRARETNYPVGAPDDDLMAMIAQGEVDLSEEARGVGHAGSRRPSVMRMGSSNAGAAPSFSGVDARPQPDSSRILLPKQIHGSGRPSIILSPYGTNWALDVLSLAHNGVRKELQDCYEILSYYELNWENTFKDEVSRFFAWWEIFESFILRYFEAEEELLFPWIVDAGGFLSDSFLEANRGDRKRKMVRLIKGIGRSHKAFLREDMRSELVTSLKFSVDRLTIMLMEYFGEEEIVLPPVIAGLFTLADKKEFDKKWADFFTTGPGGGLDCIQLSRWQLGVENRDAVKFGLKNDKAVQEWRYDNLSNLKWASYAIWEKKYVGKQVMTIQYFRDKRRKIQEGGYGPAGTMDRNRVDRAVHWNSEVQSIAITPRSNSTDSVLHTPRGSQVGAVPPGSLVQTPRSNAVGTPRSQTGFARHASDPLGHSGSLGPSRAASNASAHSKAGGALAPGSTSGSAHPSRAASQAGRSSRAPSNVSTASQKMRAVPTDHLPYKPVEGGFDPRMRFDEVLDTDSIASEREDSSVSSVVHAPVAVPVARSQAAAVKKPAPPVAQQQKPVAPAAKHPVAAQNAKGVAQGAPVIRGPAQAAPAANRSRQASSVVSGSSRQTSSVASSSRQSSSVSGSRQMSTTFSQVDFNDMY